MICRSEYEVIISLCSSPRIDEAKHYNELVSLLKDKLIVQNITGENAVAILYDGYVVTPKGLREKELYESSVAETARNEKSITISQEANEIAKEANKMSKKAHNLSIGALIVAIASALGTIVAAIIAACK